MTNGSVTSTLIEAIAQRYTFLEQPDLARRREAVHDGVARRVVPRGARPRRAIVVTHSPIIAATPGATILEVGEWGGI